MSMVRKVSVAAAVLMSAGMASAQVPGHDIGRSGLTHASLSNAEATLVKADRSTPDQPEVLLNLAAVYALSDRKSQARELYARVLSGENASLVTGSSRVANAHDIARKGISLLDRQAPTQFTAR